MLLDDAQRVADAAPDAARLDIFAGRQRHGQMAAGRSPVADDAIAGIAEWLRDRLDVAER